VSLGIGIDPADGDHRNFIARKCQMGVLVSFVVPCYNLAHLLSECIDSILAQSYVDFEILIMDNCSPDNTPEVARSFGDPRVRHVRNEVNLGHLRNFNKGITMSRGKYVWLISADDALRSPHVLARFVDLMERNPDVGYTFCRAMELQGGREVGVARFDYGNEDRIWDGPAFLPRLIRCNCIAQSSGMMRKECFEKVGLFPLDLPYAADWYLWCVLALHYRVAYFAEPMVWCRVHEESLTTLFNRGAAPVGIVDELNVLWRVSRQAELAGILSLRAACKLSISGRAARALHSGPSGGTRPGLSSAAFEAILRSHVKDAKDEEDIWALVYTSLGDEQFWQGEYRKATGSYWLGLKLRPWWLKTWTKYILMGTGTFGISARHFVYRLRRSGATTTWAGDWRASQR
jgi:glycosyltransferase involved in cell wall biosynthesis